MSDAASHAPIAHEEHPHGGRFVWAEGDQRVAFLDYRRVGERVLLDHTFVDPARRGQGIAERLVDAVIDWARANVLRVVPICSYTVVVLNRRDDLEDVVER